MKRTQKIARLVSTFWHYKTRATVLPYFPIRIWLETTNRCNLRCSVCPNATDTESVRGSMDMELYRRIIDQLAGRVNDLNLSHRGEPLFHPELETMIRMASERRLATRIHANATMLDRERAVALLDAGPDLISFSFDGYDKATYESIRIGGIFEETLQNINFFLEEKKRRGLKRPYTVIQIIEPVGMTQEYRDHLDASGRRFRAAGLDKFYVKKPHNWAGNAPGEYALDRHFLVCTFLYYSMTILWNGLVCPCPQDWYGTMVMGDLNHQTVDEVWNGEKLRELRRRASTGDLEGFLCSGCDRIFRPSFMGIPTENLKSFFTETVAGYRFLRKLVRK